MSIGGYCSRCGDCCRDATDHMADASGYCRHLRFDKVAICEFKEGVMEPVEDYEYYLKCCVPFPRNYNDLLSVPRCTYRWVTKVG